ncbi:hypothetical protein DLD77_00045 [Chitinophaga alhagiae]|uniref:Uncharacterized protein n=1 Tax=Chitinophaga alhagiae TaxID=2203219 RepID=A0ABM6W876_9BACT|nr:hypothetical protein DLD77_00045 [Chitinophaga alhagiae]
MVCCIPQITKNGLLYRLMAFSPPMRGAWRRHAGMEETVAAPAAAAAADGGYRLFLTGRARRAAWYYLPGQTLK